MQFDVIVSYDRTNQIEEIISKYSKKFGKKDIGISYKKSEITFSNDGEEKQIGLKYEFIVELPALKHDHYVYIGTIENVPVENDKNEFISYENVVFAQKDNDLSKYIKSDFRCDHCNTKHHRTTVHIFKHDIDNTEIMLGTACSKEYFGIDVYTQLNKILSSFSQYSDFQEEIDSCKGFGRTGIDKRYFTKLVYGIIKSEGRYVSRSSCDEFTINKVPTSSIANNLMNTQDSDMIKWRKEILDSLPENFDILEKVREYWFNKVDESEFIHNVQVSLKMLEPKTGLLTYAVWEYMREVEDFTGKNRFGEKIKQSQYIGAIGEKILKSEVELYNINSFNSMYGITWIISMVDSNNNVIVWKTASLPDNLVKGNKYTIKTAIIKDHNEYKGIKQTIVKNLKFI